MRIMKSVALLALVCPMVAFALPDWNVRYYAGRLNILDKKTGAKYVEDVVMYHLVDAARMEQRFVEVMTVAVIAEVQAENIPAIPQQAATRLQHVGGIDAAFPTVEQHRQATRLRLLLLRGVRAGQAHAIAAVHGHLFGAIHDRLGRPGQQYAPHAAGGQHRLDVATA